MKVLSDRVNDPRIAAKFVREARNAARIKSEHVARFIDVGTLEDGRPFVVMEDLQGQGLDALLGSGESIAEMDAVDWMLEVCEALAAAHAIGIVHRELRTSSVFLATTPTGHRLVKVMSFGTARVVDSKGREEDAGLTVAGLRSGAPDYAAPETFESSGKFPAASNRVPSARSTSWPAIQSNTSLETSVFGQTTIMTGGGSPSSAKSLCHCTYRRS